MSQRLGALVLVLPALLSPGCRRDAFRFQIAFGDSPMIQEGAQVRYLGVEVGTVEKIALSPGTGATRPQVLVSVALSDKSVHIRQGDQFTVATAGLLGETFIDIRPGPMSAPAVAPGAILHGGAPSSSSRTIVDFLTGMGITAKLQSLPQEKREALIEAFNKMISAALEEERGKSKDAHEPSTQKH